MKDTKTHRRRHRLFISIPPAGDLLPLAPEEAHYLSSVIRLREEDEVIAFDGKGSEWRTTVGLLTRKGGHLNIVESLDPVPESKLRITLFQALVKSDAMDAIIQKATELGVHRIQPVISEFCVVRLDDQRKARRLAHWQSIARSACEQSGRHEPTIIESPGSLSECIEVFSRFDAAFLLDPHMRSAGHPLPDVLKTAAVLVGPEGGFGPRDHEMLADSALRRLRFGPRILRADTAAIVACTHVQTVWGDLN